MKILYLSALQPNCNTASGNLDYQIIKHFAQNNVVDEFVIDSDKSSRISKPDFIRNYFYYQLSMKQRIWRFVANFYLPCMFAFRKSIKYKKHLIKIVDDQKYDVLLVSLSQMALYNQLLKKRMKNTILIVHDILYQSFSRKASLEQRFGVKVFYLIEKYKCFFWEPIVYNSFQNVLCLTDKDKKILESMRCTTNITVMQTCFHQFKFENITMRKFRVCFFAAFDRMENRDAVCEYIKKFHKIIQYKIKDYELVIVGKDADKYFECTNQIAVYGFLAEPEKVLNNCSISVLPIRYGAGVKTKVLEMLALGLPCVCTRVAAEGIEQVLGLDVYHTDEECIELILKWYESDIKQIKERVRKSFFSKYSDENTLKIVDKILYQS
jgi:glycosyltransferase involved in cell wall biosynthesis